MTSLARSQWLTSRLRACLLSRCVCWWTVDKQSMRSSMFSFDKVVCSSVRNMRNLFQTDPGACPLSFASSRHSSTPSPKAYGRLVAAVSLQYVSFLTVYTLMYCRRSGEGRRMRRRRPGMRRSRPVCRSGSPSTCPTTHTCILHTYTCASYDLDSLVTSLL
jgi:hypothetical protein